MESPGKPEGGVAPGITGVEAGPPAPRDPHDSRSPSPGLEALRARELDHRMANLFALVKALVRMSAAEASDTRALADDLTGRLDALAAAQALGLDRGGTAGSAGSGVTFRRLAEGVLAPFSGEGQDIRLDGPEVMLADQAGSLMALVMHELATNAVKHGALSAENGRLAIGWSVLPDGRLRIDWRERGGPPVPGTGLGKGFGAQLVETAVRTHLGGETVVEPRPDGLHLHLVIAASHFRPAPCGEAAAAATR